MLLWSEMTILAGWPNYEMLAPESRTPLNGGNSLATCSRVRGL